MTIETLRNEIDVIDSQLIDLLNHRYCYCIEIGKLKKEQNTIVLDSNREQKIIDRLSENEWYPGMVEAIWPTIMSFSKYLQNNI